MKNAHVVAGKNINIAMAQLNNKKPIIGVTIDYINNAGINQYSDYPWYALRRHYSAIIEKNGAIPIFLPFESYNSSSNEILSIIDGLLIPGGDLDVPPSMYKEDIRYDTNPGIDRSNNESIIIKKALNIDMPILGICHGMQLLNVILGGSLYQSIIDEVNNAIDHKQKISRENTHHQITIVEGTKLHSITNSKNFAVNSNHRQSIKHLGNNLIISAYCSEDNVIEAIESTYHKFVLGIEWHPEIEASSEQDNLIFGSFIKASKEFSLCKD